MPSTLNQITSLETTLNPGIHVYNVDRSRAEKHDELMTRPLNVSEHVTKRMEYLGGYNLHNIAEQSHALRDEAIDMYFTLTVAQEIAAKDKSGTDMKKFETDIRGLAPEQKTFVQALMTRGTNYAVWCAANDIVDKQKDYYGSDTASLAMIHTQSAVDIFDRAQKIQKLLN